MAYLPAQLLITCVNYYQPMQNSYITILLQLILIIMKFHTLDKILDPLL